MFGFGKSKSEEQDAPAAETAEEKKSGLFGRLKAGLARTRSGLTEGITSLVLGRKQIDDELLEELETQLLVADVGVEATQKIIADLTQRVARKELADAEALMSALQRDMAGLLAPCTHPLSRYTH